jgi:N-acylneuraminate cytidylyltransferase
MNDLSKKKNIHNRQKSSKTFDLTTIIYASPLNFIKNIKKTFWEGNVKFIEIPQIRSIDIDNLSDFNLAQIIYKNQKKLKININ